MSAIPHTGADPAGTAVRTPAQEADRRARRRLIIAALLPALYLLVAVFGPVVLPYDAVDTNTSARLVAPLERTPDGSLAVLGTDQLGRDVLRQTIEGARVSILVGLVTIVVAGGFGLMVGVVAGYREGWVGGLTMRIADMQLAFPSILLAILLAAVLGPSIPNVIITLAVTRWVFFARVSRSVSLATKARDYVAASRVLGGRARWILRRDLLPATVTPMMILGTLEFGAVIIAEASLSFLGLGSPQSTPSWGLTIANGRDYLDTAWWISTMPGIALAVLMVSIGRFGDLLRDHLDPTLRARG